MSTIFVITSGDYSDYRIHSVWSDGEEAVAKAELLNRSAPYADYCVEEYPLNTLLKSEKSGFVATYNFVEHGYSVDMKNIVVEPTILQQMYSLSSVKELGEDKVVAYAYSSEVACKVVFDKVAELHAKHLGLTT